MRRWMLAVALGLAVLPTWAANVGTLPTYDRDALQQDVTVLVDAYQQLHPGLYRYNTPAQFQAHVDTLRKALDGRRDLRETFLAFSEFAASIRCGHTYPNPTNQPESIQHALLESAGRVPFEFRWIDGKMVVTRDLTQDKVLPRGTQVVAIDGIRTPEILAKLMTIARADGSNDAKRVALLEVQGTETYETFDVYFPLFFPKARIAALDIRTPDGDARTVKVGPLSYAQRLAARHESVDDAQAGWTFDLSDPNVAVLRMPTWALYDSKWDWRAFLDRTFAELDQRKPPMLVIDLRANEGGQDVGDAILPHLVASPIELHEPPRLVRYRNVPDALAPMLDTWDPSFKDWGDDATRRDDRYFVLRDEDNTSGTVRITPKAPRYGGRVYVLVGPTNSSATFQFAEQVQRNHLATLVGQPTGGNQRGINGGAFFFLRLPNTKIEMDLPLIARIVDDAPDAGLTPDITVVPTVQDIAAGRDVELARVRAAR
ncbi:Peptidase, S41 family [Lysobacter dokdonensis DS-58]|uniref:Peptidase, S41 family n=1 Tax=Lysobacter dokdonensis DS-58 TaxID=1300345 RepID=A0A0A2X5T6_9GAMM|nr:S41 family peptidase [Lysobacter dokdonensis]KGQ20594.1 Peptidase, S41 family [Lysobacter dokdonensis DS-58]